MPDIHLQSLIHPFLAGAVPGLPAQARILCAGVTAYSGEFASLATDITFVQGFRPCYLALAEAGCRVVPMMPEGKFDCALIRLGRFRGQNEHWIGEALDRLHPGGILVAAGARTDGASSLRRRVAAMVPETGHKAMNHGEVFWFAAPADAASLATRIAPSPTGLIENRFRTAPGMFSHGHADPGSRLLVSELPDDLSGRIADFCAGWGYISAEIADRFSSVQSLHLYEADFASLEAARDNVSKQQGRIEFSWFWQDLRTEAPAAKYDVIVMNPPFHAGRRAEPEIGRAMIARAASALKPGGRLFLVANRHMPYETVVDACFEKYREKAAVGGYKVIEACKPRSRTRD